MTDPVLQALRDEIDILDAKLLDLVAQRFEVTRRVGAHKRENNLPKADPQREAVQIARLEAMAKERNIDPVFSAQLLRLIIDEVIRDYAREELQ